MLKRRLEPDLLLLDILTLLVVPGVFAFPDSWLRYVIGIPFLLFFPGYMLVAVVFPTRDRPSGTTRVALSVGFSVVLMVFSGLLLGVTIWGISLTSATVWLVILTLFLSAVAWYRRGKLGPEARFAVGFRARLTSVADTVRNSSHGYRILAFVLIGVLLGGIGAAGYIMARPVAGQPFTEFYLLGEKGQATGYPREIQPGDTGRVIVGIVNHENTTAEYYFQVTVDEEVIYESSLIRLETDEKWENEVEFTLYRTGDKQKVEFRLYRDGGESCETRYLWIDVQEPGEVPEA